MNRSSMDGFQYMRNLVVDCYSWIEAKHQSRSLDGMSTGFVELDGVIGGLNWGELIVIGGYAHMGKTALALDMARHVAIHAEEEGRVAILSLDEPATDVSMRMLTAEARVEQRKITSGLLSAQRWRRLASAADRFASADIFIGYFPYRSLQVLRKKINGLLDEYGPLDLVVIDHLWAMRDWQEEMDNKHKLYELMEGLHNMAKDLDVALIVVSELSRPLHERTEKRPRLTDFMEYDPIELLRFDDIEPDVAPFECLPMTQFASKVLLLYREEAPRPTDENRGKAELIVAQNVDGETGVIDLKFRTDFVSFVEYRDRF